MLIFYINNLAAEDIARYEVTGNSIIKPLNDLTGKPERGQELFRDQNKGNCLACHRLSTLNDSFQGNIGPLLDNVTLRLTEAQIRLRIADMKQVNPYSIMPGFYRSPERINRISPLYEGSTILTAQEVEDIVSYLVSLNLKSSGEYK